MRSMLGARMRTAIALAALVLAGLWPAWSVAAAELDDAHSCRDLLLSAADVPGGYIAQTQQLDSPLGAYELRTFRRGELNGGALLILSTALQLDRPLDDAAVAETADGVLAGLRRSLGAEGQVSEAHTLDASTLGEHARLLVADVQPAPSANPVEFAVAVFGRGDRLVIVAVASDDGQAVRQTRAYAALLDARTALAR